MMSAYTDRMESLQAQTRRNQLIQNQATNGLPLYRPGANDASGFLPAISPDRPDTGEDESYKNSHFYMNFDHHRQNDPHFDAMTGELTQLAAGLRDQVQQGYMPAFLAKQRVIQYVTDTMAHYQRNAPEINKARAQQAMKDAQGALLTSVANWSKQNPTPDSPMAQQMQAQAAMANQPDPNATNAAYSAAAQRAAQTSAATAGANGNNRGSAGTTNNFYGTAANAAAAAQTANQLNPTS